MNRIILDDYGFVFYSRAAPGRNMDSEDGYHRIDSVPTMFLRHNIQLSHESYELNSGSNGLGIMFNQFIFECFPKIDMSLVHADEQDLHWKVKCFENMDKPGYWPRWCHS